MKYFYSLLVTFSCIAGFAQDLAIKIPKEALVVATIKGDNLTQLMSISEINNSYLGQELLKDMSRNQDQPFKSLEDLGLNLEASSYYFYQATDSISYNVILVPIKDVSKFEHLMTSKKDLNIITKGGFKTLDDQSKTSITVLWDQSTMVLVMGDISDYYFEDEEVMKRYGLQEIPAYSYGEETTEVYSTPYEEDVITEAVEVTDDDNYIIEAPMIESTEAEEAAEEVEDSVMEVVEDVPEVIEAPVIEEPMEKVLTVSPPPPPPPMVMGNDVDVVEGVYDENVYDTEPYDDSYNDSYNTAYNNNYDIKKGLEKEWSMAQAIKILSQSAEQSIVNNKSYLKSLDKNAEATLWIGDFAKIYENLVGGYYFNNLLGFNMGSMYSNSGMSAKLYAEKEDMRLTTSYFMSESMAKSYKKMMDQKLNRKFLDYVNEDRMIGYMSYAVNTEAALTEYPKILKNLYGNLPMYGEEASLAVDLVELLLDEAAVAKVFPGDMLFLLSGISEKEMTYKSYEYNDDYEYEEIEKTKKETVPDFLMMISSEDQTLMKKLVNYGIKKEVVEAKNDYYALKIPESPLAVFLAFKNDIVFLGTSEDEIIKIMTGKFDSKVSSKHKKILKNSNYSVYLSGKQLASKIPVDDLGVRDMKMLNWFLSNSEDAYITSSKMKGNTLEAEMVIGVPASQENSLKYIFNMIETFAK